MEWRLWITPGKEVPCPSMCISNRPPPCPGHFPVLWSCTVSQEGLQVSCSPVKTERHRVWLPSQCLFLARSCFLWEARGLQIVIPHPLSDCSIMCAMLLWMLWPPLSWKLLLIYDYPLNFLPGPDHLLQTCSLFISVANHHHHDKCSLMHVSWLKRPGTVWASKSWHRIRGY